MKKKIKTKTKQKKDWSTIDKIVENDDDITSENELFKSKFLTIRFNKSIENSLRNLEKRVNEKIFDNESIQKFYTNFLNDSNDELFLEMRDIIAKIKSIDVSIQNLFDLVIDFIVRSHSSSAKIATRSKFSVFIKIANSKISVSKIVKTSIFATQKSTTFATQKSTISATQKSTIFAIQKSAIFATQKSTIFAISKSATFAVSMNELVKKAKTKKAKITVNIDFENETRIEKKTKKSSKSKSISKALVETKIMKIKQTKREMMKRMHRINTNVENRRFQIRKKKTIDQQRHE